MTDLEKAIAAGGAVQETDLQRALKSGGSVEGGKSKYPQPKSLSADDQALGLETGAVKSARAPGTGLSVPLRPDMSQVEFDHRAAQAGNDVNRVEGAMATSVIGGGVGTAAKAALAAKAGSVVAPVTKVIEQAIENSFGHGHLLGTAAKIAQAAAPATTAAIATGVTKAIPAAVRAGAAGGAAVGTAAAPEAARAATEEFEPAPFKGVMTNAIEKLRAAAVGDARARELLQRIEAAQNTPSGTVSQGTLGGGH